MWDCHVYHLAFGEWLRERLDENEKVYAEFARDIWPGTANPFDRLKARWRLKKPTRWGVDEVCRIAAHSLFRDRPSSLLAQVEHYLQIHKDELEKKLAKAAKTAENAPPEGNPAITVT